MYLLREEIFFYNIALLVVCCKLTCGYITRLDCNRHAHFREQNDKFMEGSSSSQLTVESARGCGIKCIFSENCLVVNYKSSTNTCQLFNTRQGTIIDKPGWNHYRTDFIDWKLGGENCRRGNSCEGWQYCRDACNDVGYICKEDNNVALGKQISEITYISSGTKADVLDGDLSTLLKTGGNPGAGGRAFVVDLLSVYDILEVIVVSHPDFKNICEVQVKETAGESYYKCGMMTGAPTDIIACERRVKYIRFGHCTNSVKLAVKEVMAIILPTDWN